LAEVGAVKLCLRWEPIDQDGPADAQEHGEHSFGGGRSWVSFL
jgi:hypothetical protein